MQRAIQMVSECSYNLIKVCVACTISVVSACQGDRTVLLSLKWRTTANRMNESRCLRAFECTSSIVTSVYKTEWSTESNKGMCSRFCSSSRPNKPFRRHSAFHNFRDITNRYLQNVSGKYVFFRLKPYGSAQLWRIRRQDTERMSIGQIQNNSGVQNMPDSCIYSIALDLIKERRSSIGAFSLYKFEIRHNHFVSIVNLQTGWDHGHKQLLDLNKTYSIFLRFY